MLNKSPILLAAGVIFVVVIALTFQATLHPLMTPSFGYTMALARFGGLLQIGRDPGARKLQSRLAEIAARTRVPALVELAAGQTLCRDVAEAVQPWYWPAVDWNVLESELQLSVALTGLLAITYNAALDSVYADRAVPAVTASFFTLLTLAVLHISSTVGYDLVLQIYRAMKELLGLAEEALKVHLGLNSKGKHEGVQTASSPRLGVRPEDIAVSFWHLALLCCCRCCFSRVRARHLAFQGRKVPVHDNLSTSREGHISDWTTTPLDVHSVDGSAVVCRSWAPGPTLSAGSSSFSEPPSPVSNAGGDRSPLHSPRDASGRHAGYPLAFSQAGSSALVPTTVSPVLGHRKPWAVEPAAMSSSSTGQTGVMRYNSMSAFAGINPLQRRSGQDPAALHSSAHGTLPSQPSPSHSHGGVSSAAPTLDLQAITGLNPLHDSGGDPHSARGSSPTSSDESSSPTVARHAKAGPRRLHTLAGTSVTAAAVVGGAAASGAPAALALSGHDRRRAIVSDASNKKLARVNSAFVGANPLFANKATRHVPVLDTQQEAEADTEELDDLASKSKASGKEQQRERSLYSTMQESRLSLRNLHVSKQGQQRMLALQRASRFVQVAVEQVEALLEPPYAPDWKVIRSTFIALWELVEFEQATAAETRRIVSEQAARIVL